MNNQANRRHAGSLPDVRSLLCGALLLCGLVGAPAFQKPDQPPLPNFDKRAQKGAAAWAAEAGHRAARAQLEAKLPDIQIDLDPILGSPKRIATRHGFLSGPNGRGRGISAASAAGYGANDPHRAAKAFLREHQALFGHGPEALAGARIKREFTTAHNGLRTVVWQQQVDDIEVFEGLFLAHITRNEELVNVSSRFVPDPGQAANKAHANRAALLAAPSISAAQAIAAAAQSVGENLGSYQVTALDETPQGAEKRQRFKATVLRGEASARLIWLPMNRTTLRLCWEVILTSRSRGEMFRLLIDAETGEAHLRHGLTAYLSNATYRVFTSDSPSPFSPGHPTPSTNQPPLVARTLVTLDALNTNASPNGWINDGANETRGNNVDAHTDRNNDNSPDLPRPQGSPFRVFDFPMNLASDAPTAYSDAAVTQLFYWNNWMHDRLYELGFTEEAGNFQTDNFSRGGFGNDAVQADAQDGGGFNNANMDTPPDGSAPRMQMYLFDGPTPDLDGDLDAEIILHEYTHGLSNRRVGGGVGIYQLQSAGMGEGWSDFYGLALLGEAGDNLDGNYAAGGYLTYRFFGLTQNYYFGIRRYPYTTDLSKNPLTFKDIDPNQASSHAGIPINPVISGGSADEVHNQGEVWCVALWEVRANLIRLHGFSVGNQLTLQLVTDGMNLSPANPTFLEARDAILQADEVLTGGANRNPLWAGFAKRGMGLSATAPDSSTTFGVQEAFDVPDDLVISPGSGFTARGNAGGPFMPTTQTFSLANVGTNVTPWSATKTAGWLTLSNGAGSLAPGASSPAATVSINASAYFLTAGVYTDDVVFSNHLSGVTQARRITLAIGQPDYFTELFSQNDNDLQNQTLTFTPEATPTGAPSFYTVCRETATAFPTSPRRGKQIYLGVDNWYHITLAGPARVSLYGRSTNAFYIGSNGYLTFDYGDANSVPSLAAHFNQPRISGLFTRLQPGTNGITSWQQLPDRVAVTFQDMTDAGGTNLNSFQIEMFYDGRIRLTHLAIGTRGGLVGLSRGAGQPGGFFESDLNSYPACGPRLLVTVPLEATEGQGTLAGQGAVILPAPAAADVTVALTSSDAGEVTVPPTVLIPAGQTNVTFDLLVTDDAELDGTQNAVIGASSSAYNGGSAGLVIHDNESGVLTVTLPPSVSEGAGTVAGIVSVNAPVSGDVVVALSSGAPQLIDAPAFVVIPSGTNAATFIATIANDSRINGARTAQLTAQVQNWTDGLGAITVLDDENLDLAVALPAAASEASGVLPGAAQVIISGTLTSNLVVSFSSSDTTELIVPAGAIIAAGQTSVSFDLTLVDDDALDGSQVVTLTAGAPGFSSGSAGMIVTDDETPDVPGNPRPANLASNVPLNVVLGWSSGEGELIVNGDFETGDLTGWQAIEVGNGRFRINDGTVDPSSPDGPLPPFAGQFNAFVDQDGGGNHTLFQDIQIPGSAATATLRWAHRIRNHASAFTDGQSFRVEIRDTGDNVLAVAFSTQPGDVFLQDWMERNYDLTPWRGRTVRVAFAESDELYYFNAHVDNISVQVSSPNPTLFDVRFGTNPTPGPAELLGTTGSNSWHLPSLAPLTTYYWQVVARRVGSAASPVWQFTTRGLDHFTISSVAEIQHATVPFAVTVTARDELNGVVSNFTGTVALDLAASADSSYTLLNSPTPQNSGFGNYTIGYSFTPITDVMVTHLRPYSGGKVSIWTAGGQLLISQNVTSPSGSWSETPVPSPLHLLAGNTYVVGFYTGSGNYFGRFDMDSIFPHGTIEQSYEVIGDAFPSAQSSWRWIFVDLRYELTAPSSTTITPSVSGNFVDGSWTGSLTALGTASNVRLRAEDSEGHTGLSNPFNIRGAPGTLDHFEWSEIASPQLVNTPFAATLTALDSLGSIVTNFNSQAGLSGRAAGPPVPVGGGTATSVYPLASFFEGARSQVIYLADEIGGPRQFGALALQVAAPPGQALRNWTIRMKHTTLTQYGPAPVWESEDWTTVHEGTAAIAAPGWITFPFSTPFAYDGQNNLMIDFSFDNLSFSFDGECYVTPTAAPRSINFSTDGEWGEPLSWSGGFPVPEMNQAIPNLRLAPHAPAIAFTPGQAAPFTNGVWSGDLTVQEPVSNLRLRADDGLGHAGESNPFEVNLRDDLALSMTASANPAAVGDTLTYLLRVTNSGPSAATGVLLTNVLPAGITTATLTPSQGSCVNVSGVVRCDLGTLAATEEALVEITFAPGTNGILTNRASVTRAEPDFYPSNNRATNVTEVRMRHLLVNEPQVQEGDQGTTNALFSLRLSLPSAQPIQVNFATANSSAVAGSDYRATNGTVRFESGQIEHTIPVTILSDRLYEFDESFSLNFSLPPNTMLSYFNTTGHIRNDDPQPSVSIGDASVVEGQSGTRNAVFSVALSAPSSLPVTAYFYTSDVTAASPSDYVGTNSSVVIPAGQTNGTISIVVKGDTDIEFDETFSLWLNSAVNAGVADSQGVGTIVSDDIRALILPWNVTLISEVNANDAIDPGETVTVSFALRNAGNRDTTNLVATLAAGGGVSNPGGAETYGMVRFNGGPVSRPFTFTVNGTNGGTLTATLQLQDNDTSLGDVTFQMPIGPVAGFRIASLETNGCLAIEHGSVTGDDRGGIAVSASQVFYTGDNATARFSRANLSGGTSVGRIYDVLVSDLRTEKVYALGNGSVPINGSGALVNTLLEINGDTGALTGNSIPLSSPVQMIGNSGIFAGYGRVAFYTGGRVYNVTLPSGSVSDLGALTLPQYSGCEHWAFWGVAEHFSNAVHLVYVRDLTGIVRTRVPDGLTTVVSSFTSLSDMCSFTVSLSRNRWYFHHEGTSQFRSGDETIGYCDARFTLAGEASPVGLDHFEWGPIPPARLVNAPFPVTLTARDSANRAVPGFQGTVALSAFGGAGAPSSRTVLGSPVHSNSGIGNFTRGYAFTPNTNLTVTDVRHYGGTKVSIWTDGGVLLASNTVSGTPGVWSETPLTAPLLLTAGTRYRVSTYAGGTTGLYYWRTDLPATFADGVIEQGYSSAGDAFPSNAITVRWFFVDLRYLVGGQPLPLTPTASGNFVAGVWSGTVTVGQTMSNVVLRADDGNGHFGTSNPFRVVASGSGTLDHFAWSAIASPQTNAVPFTATLTAQDDVGGTVSNYTGQVSLSARGSLSTSFMLRGDEEPSLTLPAGNFTLGYAFTPTNDVLATHLRHFSGSRVSIWTGDGVLLASQSVTSAPALWTETPLATPLQLQAHTRYVVAFHTGGEAYFWRDEDATNFSHGTINGSFYALGEAFPGNPFSEGFWLVDLRFSAIGTAPLALDPITVASFVNGTWTGQIMIPYTADNVVLHGVDLLGHPGESNPFQVIDALPHLFITRSGNQAVISWTTTAPGFLLESTAGLSAVPGWTATTNAALVTGTNYVVTNSVSGAGQFYRLRKY